MSQKMRKPKLSVIISNDKEWYGRSSAEIREEVLKYYDLPKEKQHHINIE